MSIVEMKAGERPPILVYAHGGGFMQGSISSWDHFMRDLVRQSGVAALSVDYKLSPEVKFPVAFDEMLENMLTASVVLLFVTPLTVGAMLYRWRRTGPVRELRQPLLRSMQLLLAFVGTEGMVHCPSWFPEVRL